MHLLLQSPLVISHIQEWQLGLENGIHLNVLDKIVFNVKKTRRLVAVPVFNII